MLKYQVLSDDYWMKTLCTVYSYDLNKRTKYINKGGLIEKFFPLLARYGECFIDTRAQSKINNHGLLIPF